MINTIKNKKRRKIKISTGRIVFNIFNYAFLTAISLIFVLLFMHIIAISLSGKDAILSNKVGLFPVDFTLNAYRKLMGNQAFWKAFLRSVFRVIYALFFVMTIVILTAYPLSKFTSKMKSRNFYMWFLFIPALFSGGIIPLYILISDLHMMNTLSALVIPTSVSIFNVILLLNFIRQLPKELLESADIDGANEITKLVKIVIPCCKPAIATIALFTIVGHWNSWFDGMLFSTNPDKYPLQSYLEMVVEQSKLPTNSPDANEDMADKSISMAQYIVAMMPVILIYPFFQKYFVKGIVLGSVKE